MRDAELRALIFSIQLDQETETSMVRTDAIVLLSVSHKNLSILTIAQKKEKNSSLSTFTIIGVNEK
jgi:hypothetical protein